MILDVLKALTIMFIILTVVLVTWYTSILLSLVAAFLFILVVIKENKKGK